MPNQTANRNSAKRTTGNTTQLKVVKSTDDQQKKLNEAKYGSQDDDVIARTYRESVFAGDVWCGKNVERYLRRFLSDSHKGKNMADLKKALDYLQRMVKFHEQAGDLENKDIIEK